MAKNEKEIPRHQPPKGSKSQNQELLYDPNVATSSHAEQALTLVSKMSTATLCTMSIGALPISTPSSFTSSKHGNESNKEFLKYTRTDSRQ